MAFIGLKTYSSDGFEDRFPAYISQVVAYPKNFKLSQWRQGECYLYSENKFGSNCVDNGFQNSSSNVFLWGDSIAASLSPGFRYVQPNRFSFAQYTVGNCPPFLDYDDPNNKNCREITKSVIKEIETLKPHTVFLSAYWLKFYRVNPDQVKDKIPQTVDFLRRSGVKNIVFIGPLPLWNPTLPLMIFQRYKIDHIIPSPERMMLNTDSETLELDKTLQEVSSHLGVTYVSAHQLLCDSHGCLVRVGNNYEDIFSFDTMHLTIPAARFFVKSIFDSNQIPFQL